LHKITEQDEADARHDRRADDTPPSCPTHSGAESSPQSPALSGQIMAAKTFCGVQVDGDKFQRLGLSPKRATKVAAPLIVECYANFECRLRDTRMIRTYGLFIWEVVKPRVAMSPKRPQTIHYRGEGEFMMSGGTINRRRKFRPENL
jgi:flavin reductase (DIM6/NTAB) family NADH-FMN oxidoreductase RutF